MIIQLEDQNELVPTKNYPNYATFPFENFNPVQSRIFDIFDRDCNVLVAAATSSGKTVTAEMIAAFEVNRGGKVIYLAPLKALAKEKLDDWTNPNHHFSKLKQAICTGDYRLTPERKKELDDAQLVMMTTEMLNARVRNFTSEHNEWIKNVTLIVSDEHHLLCVLGRGDKLEIGLMKFCDINPKARIVGLSATMPNVQEIAEWTQELNGKETYLINSKYRPCPLGIHWEVYPDVGSYDVVEENKVEAAIELVEAYNRDKFLVFVHTKKTGEIVKKSLKAKGIDCEFHNADLEKDKRETLEKRFKTDKNFRVLIATSTVAWGLNLPARRVVIVGVHRGLDEVEQYDIKQMVGRSGRVGLDPRGDAYILVPERKADYHIARLSKEAKIESRLLDYIGTEENPHYKTLAFHLVSELHHGEVQTKEDIKEWYKRTLASFQSNDLHDDILDSTLELLQKYNAIKLEDGIYKTTVVGNVASMFYYSPFDVADLRRNFKFLFDNNYQNNDIAVAMALGAVDTLKMQYVSKGELEEMGSFAAKVGKMYGNAYTSSAIKGGYAYFLLLHGLNPGLFAAIARNAQHDFDRTKMVLNALDSMACRWEQRPFFNELGLRLAYGVTSELVPLCRLPNVGKVRAEKLWAAGLRSYKQIAESPQHVQKILNMKQDKIDEICLEARNMSDAKMA